jgi:hypothetical protein
MAKTILQAIKTAEEPERIFLYILGDRKLVARVD